MINENQPIIVRNKTVACYKFLWDIISLDKGRVAAKKSAIPGGIIQKKTRVKKFFVKNGVLISEIPQ